MGKIIVDELHAINQLAFCSYMFHCLSFKEENCPLTGVPLQPFYCPITSRLRFQKINENDINGEGEDLVKRPVYLGIISGEIKNLPVLFGDRSYKAYIF